MVRVPNVSHVVGYYDQPEMLRFQVEQMALWSPALRGGWEFVVVDDASPVHPILPDPAYRAFRVLDDVPWNDKGARNIGVAESRANWLLVSDIDHVVPEDTARVLVETDWPDYRVFSFERRLLDGSRHHPHPNSFFLSRALWDRIGGCDERLSGCYGGDSEWRARAERISGGPILSLERDLIQVTTDDVPDAWVTTMKRKTRQNTKRRAAILQDIKARPGPMTMTFSYETI